MLLLNRGYLAAFLFGLRISALFNRLSISIPFPIQVRSVLELQVSSYDLNIGQDWLNVGLTKYLVKYRQGLIYQYQYLLSVFTD